MFRYIFLAAIFASQSAAAAPCVTTPTSHFSLKGDEAYDQTTGLTWKRCALGMQWDKAHTTCSGAAETYNLDAAKAAARAAGPGWRVPRAEDLETIMIGMCDGPQVDRRAFPAIEASDFGEGATFWTTSEAMSGMFYYFDFVNGLVDMHSPGYGLSVLLVKNR